MDTIEFVTTYSRIEDYKVVEIYINGMSLIDMLRQIETPLAFSEGAPEMAGAYEGLPPLYVFPPSRHFYGKADKAYSHGNKISLLEYAFSGVPGEWPFAAQILLSDEQVIWTDFEQLRRNKLKNGHQWQYDMLGSFVFERRQYDAALLQAAKDAY
ncbi:MAG: hypothetical protein ACLFUB_02640 [Cyclobacteriaceae bacterium]